MLAFHLLQWELFAIFAPQKMRVDIFNLLISYGCSLVFCFFDANGKCTTDRIRLSRKKKDRFCYDMRLERAMRNVTVKFCSYFHNHALQGNKHRKTHFGEKEFNDLWREAIPEPFSSDLNLALRLKNLCKIMHLTYACKDSTRPFQAIDRISESDPTKRLM